MLYPIYPKRYGCDGTGFQKFETPFANGEIILEHGIAFRRCSEWNLREAETNSKWNTIIQNTT